MDLGESLIQETRGERRLVVLVKGWLNLNFGSGWCCGKGVSQINTRETSLVIAGKGLCRGLGHREVCCHRCEY